MAEFDRLALPWRLAFDEAWASFQAGDFGVGAVLVDPETEGVVSVGRNRVGQGHRLPGVISGNMTAHAEMNAFAALDRFNAAGLHLYTTLEPCLMCAATAMQLKVAHVDFAAADEFFSGMDGLWAHHPVTAARQPASAGPLPAPFGAFARLLPMHYNLRHLPGRTAEQLARRHHPRLAAVIDALPGDPMWTEIARAGSVTDALDHLAPALH